MHLRTSVIRGREPGPWSCKKAVMSEVTPGMPARRTPRKTPGGNARRQRVKKQGSDDPLSFERVPTNVPRGRTFLGRRGPDLWGMHGCGMLRLLATDEDGRRR